MNTSNQIYSKDFAPLDYGDLSDYDLDSPDIVKYNKKYKAPSPINLNQLYVSNHH